MTIERLYELYTIHHMVDTDTRTIRENTLFFALQGANFNGNTFAVEALQKGALYSIVDDSQYAVNDQIIVVDNVLQTLQELANYHRKQLGIPIIALTGSNGKTTTKELLNAVLSKKYKVTSTKGNLNNAIGVPLTLLSMTPETEIGVVEMGANHKKEIAFLCTIAAPDYGYITNFGKAHLEGFGSLEGVIEGKSELYEFLGKHHKTVFVNPFDAIQLQKTQTLQRVLFNPSISFIKANPFVVLTYNEVNIDTQLFGTYNFSNIAAAITIGEYFKVDKSAIIEAISQYIPTNNRSQILEEETNQVILDAYNANPTSMKAALDNFNTVPATKKMVILGDMFELGQESLYEHQQIVNLLSQYHFDMVFLVGDHFNKTASDYHHFPNFDTFRNYFTSIAVQNYCILIKGSRGMALERIIDEIE